ncbi:MAG: hypothetical protein ABSG57_05300 [Candidatus Bathyarchaeia archaeon]
MDFVAREVFTLFFAIFYGTTVAQTGWLHPFSTHEAWSFGVRSPAFKRLIVSVVLLNFLPLAYFSFLYVELGMVSVTTNVDLANLAEIFLIALLSLAPFGFSRIYAGVVVYGNACLYDPKEYRRIRKKRIYDFCEKEVKGKIIIDGERVQRTVFDNCCSHIISGLCFVLIPLLLLGFFLLLQ